MAFHVVDYKGCTAENRRQGRVVFTHRTYEACVNWLEANQTDADLDADRYCLDGDPASWRRKFGAA